MVPDIIQVNWSWYFPTHTPNQKAYERVRQASQAFGWDWAITEHMTFNGSDFNHYSDGELRQILLNTLMQGTRFGREFVSIDASTAGSFSLYNDDWTPKTGHDGCRPTLGGLAGNRARAGVDAIVRGQLGL